jgi:hypothetical protein
MPNSSTDRRYRAGDLIRRRGVEMPHPREPCQRRRLQCFASSSTGICSECYTFHRKCSLTIPRSAWQQLDSEQERLKRDLERVTREKRRFQRRLRRVQNDERRLLAQELQSIEEMEDLEEADAQGPFENDPAVTSGVQGSSSAGGGSAVVDQQSRHDVSDQQTQADVFDWPTSPQVDGFDFGQALEGVDWSLVLADLDSGDEIHQ